jgi:hypothetical protein
MRPFLLLTLLNYHTSRVILRTKVHEAFVPNLEHNKNFVLGANSNANECLFSQNLKSEDPSESWESKNGETVKTEKQRSRK